uniref:Uncharacterized protein n=1 Tax=Polytomella parva TaxID=51329 RepID=A0A7S0YJ90_9CHLO|mmetsp:Transcript_29460/g.54066  ORF Transcript_29460/g.54066 Transcript_29460/m.54066 type:complete len:272 (+) Transcript_29460:120-935(+)|eukprot:CAMPEP_0175073874 /NCGR_PEP_ID=MMETSP0052_2-20121109/20874_1 /TAXON_ID=51329 ORGANISM="Polytomella parva, Strain SAG 63-3" /NCGR_SAMPLE_ID=MMETSP0052_2 /ASSEMBLY_ACC=CAM_ASM_000194 /LENGTH=271 /DNA_ID=CAMNT_0016341871 /DNA_START=88 /DNA_END=903 /DNA_ORIENTATION=+
MEVEQSNESNEICALYNKNEKTTATLVGNWQEERALKNLTGFARNEVHNDVNEKPGLYATRQDKHLPLPTFPRVMVHVDAQIHPSDWKSVSHVIHSDPKSTQYLSSYKGTLGKGPRAAMEEAMLAEMAKDLPPEVEYTLSGRPIPQVLSSTYGDDFQAHDLTGLKLGARVMRDHDGRPKTHDPTFLVETKMAPRHRVDRVLGETAKNAGALATTQLPNPDIPVTIYSESVATKNFGKTFVGTTVTSQNAPFNRYSNFSKPMGEYNKLIVDE